MTQSKFALLFLVASACEGGAAIGPNDGELQQNLLVPGATYSDLRTLETTFPLPATTQNIDVGTLNASNGGFTGLTPTTQCELDPILHKPHCFQVPPSVNINAVAAVLVFHSSYAASPLRVTINGHTTSAPNGATSLSVNVMRSKD